MKVCLLYEWMENNILEEVGGGKDLNGLYVVWIFQTWILKTKWEWRRNRVKSVEPIHVHD